METFHESMTEYRKQLHKGSINRAYKGLMEYMMNLRTSLNIRHPDFYISGSLYFGYMDMTYFSFYPKSIKDRNLKIAIVFNHLKFTFEVWLAGVNKQVQQNYWKQFSASGWDKYWVVPTIQGVDSIVEHVLVENPDFSDLDSLSEQIEAATFIFIQDIEEFFSAKNLDP
jgi:hypothetical protein